MKEISASDELPTILYEETSAEEIPTISQFLEKILWEVLEGNSREILYGKFGNSEWIMRALQSRGPL